MRPFHIVSVAALVLVTIYLTSYTEATCSCGPRIRIRPLSQRDPSLPRGGQKLCWLFAATMAKRWEMNDESISILQVAQMGREESRFRSGDGLPPSRHNAFLDAIGMTNFQFSPQPQGMCDLLKTYGPIYVGKSFSGTVGRHIVLITGLSGTCDTNGVGTTVVGIDSWTGNTYRKSWADFMAEWGFAQSADAGKDPAALAHFKNRRSTSTCASFTCPSGFAKLALSNSDPRCTDAECVEKCCEAVASAGAGAGAGAGAAKPVTCPEFTCPSGQQARQQSIPGTCVGQACIAKCCEVIAPKA